MWMFFFFFLNQKWKKEGTFHIVWIIVNVLYKIDAVNHAYQNYSFSSSQNINNFLTTTQPANYDHDYFLSL